MTGDDRQRQLRDWYRAWSGRGDAQLRAVSGDASFRRYFRSGTGADSVILVDSPPDKEKNAEFVAIAGAMADAGLPVPHLEKVDLNAGFLALEDFGDELLLPGLNEQSVDDHYAQALDLLQQIAAMKALPVPVYSAQKLIEEMGLFPEWFCDRLLELDMPDTLFTALGRRLCNRALAQYQVPVHRDFHARNLMRLPDGCLGIIDFQDAVIGPVTYDLVSLLKDCYVRWPLARVEGWALAYRQQLIDGGIALPGEEDFLRDFHWMGLQRHIKVLGIFVRLYLRDGKSAYLGDLPRVIAYVREALALYPREPALQDFLAFFESEAMPRVTRQAWYRAA